MSMNGLDASADDGPRIGPGGRAPRAEIPAQAQVAAWARGRAACWAERATELGHRTPPACWAERHPAGPRKSDWAARLGKAFGPN
jgi:hypothetical protein